MSFLKKYAFSEKHFRVNIFMVACLIFVTLQQSSGLPASTLMQSNCSSQDSKCLQTNPLTASNEDAELSPVAFTRIKRQTRCGSKKFACADGTCISSTLKCDGKKECPDGSDETLATCQNTRCPAFAFRCSYGACVDGTAKCDGKQDCADNSDELHRDCRKATEAPNSCPNKRDFQCADGRTCIKRHLVCDGEKNCPSGSDETLQQCSNKVCASYLFRCAYGACVNGGSDCNNIVECADGSDETAALCSGRQGWTPLTVVVPTPAPPPPTAKPPAPAENGCVLPPQPESGSYSVLKQGVELVPGQTVNEFTILQYSCNKKYQLDSKPSTVYCQSGQWSETKTCYKKCDPLFSLTADLVCKYGDLGETVPCNQSMPHRTIVTATCKDGHHFKTSRVKQPVCKEGSWTDPLPQCEAECGVVSGKGTALVVGGYQAKKGEFPWHVGIYDNSKGELMQICGGTIATINIIITAAHCFWEPNSGTLLPAENYAVAGGKIYRDWEHPDETQSYIQKSYVKKIYIMERYHGNTYSQAQDIAVLTLITPFHFTDSVHPICLDLNDRTLDSTQLAGNNIGKVAGWGLTDNKAASDVLKTANLPFVDHGQCTNNVPEGFKPFITPDKICGGYTNGTALCQGDSGGGFVFPSEVHGMKRYYLRGVVSVGPSNDEGGCSENSYTAFTRIFQHADFIEGAMESASSLN